MKIKFEWENIFLRITDNEIAGNVNSRAKVIGGWIIRDITWQGTSNMCQGIVFLSDPNHEWEIEES